MWSVTFPAEKGKARVAKWEPGLTYVIRIREAGTGQWSFGFETPIPGCTFVDLKPDTEYELQIRAKDIPGEGEPVYITIRATVAGVGRERGGDIAHDMAAAD